jgi:hypothetical protein
MRPPGSSAQRLARTLRAAALAVAALLVMAIGNTATSSAAPASAQSAANAAATRRYIVADYQLTRSARAKLARTVSAIEGLAKRTIAECPLAGEGSYGNNAANEFSEEVIGTLVTTGYHPDAGAIDAFVGAASHLRWSDRALTRIVHTFVTRLENLARLAPANICTDTKAFAAAEFKTAPEATVRFDKLYLAADIEAEEVPLRMLAPYEDAHDVALLSRIKRLEAPLADAEAKAVGAFTKIMRGLALSQ